MRIDITQMTSTEMFLLAFLLGSAACVAYILYKILEK
jgi:hypothetical protein